MAKYAELSNRRIIRNGTTVDIGRIDQGYIQVKHKASKKRLKLRISCGNKTYTYDLNQDGKFEVFPLQMGNGKYKVRSYEQVRGTQYSIVSSISFDVQIANKNFPFLYPNQYVMFDAESKAVSMANVLCEGLTTDEQKVKAIKEYVEKFMYDHIKAITIRGASTYLPNVDATLLNRNGICFDFASLVCCMLRSQNIPTKLIVGHADASYHAWNRALIDGKWKLIDTTAKITNMKFNKYTSEKVY